MRILYVGDEHSPHFRAWCSHFAKRGHDIHTFDTSELVGGMRGSWLAGIPSLARLRRRLRPDIVHSHQTLPGGYLAERSGSGPHVATAWGSEVLLASRAGRALVRRVARGADLLTADSRHLLGMLRDAGAAEAKLRWVPWGVEAGWADEARGLSRAEAAVRAGLPGGRPLVMSHRGPAPVYRQEDFVRAMGLVARQAPEVLGIVPALDRSPGRRDTERVRELVAALAIDGSVRVVDPWPHAEVAFAYRAASACVSVPSSDSAPTSVFEAFAAGTPAIVSGLPWVSEPVYSEAQLGVVEPGDVEGLAAAILTAVGGALDDSIGPNRELVARSLDRDTLFDAIGEEYERLAGEGG